MSSVWSDAASTDEEDDEVVSVDEDEDVASLDVASLDVVSEEEEDEDLMEDFTGWVEVGGCVSDIIALCDDDNGFLLTERTIERESLADMSCSSAWGVISVEDGPESSSLSEEEEEDAFRAELSGEGCFCFWFWFWFIGVLIVVDNPRWLFFRVIEDEGWTLTDRVVTIVVAGRKLSRRSITDFLYSDAAFIGWDIKTYATCQRVFYLCVYFCVY